MMLNLSLDLVNPSLEVKEGVRPLLKMRMMMMSPLPNWPGKNRFLYQDNYYRTKNN